MTKAVKKPKTDKENLDEIGAGAYSAICELVGALQEARESEITDEGAYERAERAIHEDALSVEVRSGWYTLEADADKEPAEFMILLTAGGPAVRIIGQLEYGEPSSARLEVQDWGTPWTEYTSAQEEDLLAYASCFCFGT